MKKSGGAFSRQTFSMHYTIWFKAMHSKTEIHIMNVKKKYCTDGRKVCSDQQADQVSHPDIFNTLSRCFIKSVIFLIANIVLINQHKGCGDQALINNFGLNHLSRHMNLKIDKKEKKHTTL